MRARRPIRHRRPTVLETELLRFATAGSVDDGKSTLIGRLLLRHQGDPRRPARARRGGVQRRAATATLNLALLTDGLRAEREQGITIDVAYRYFATPQRTFIIADTPGHVQYTRNMVTGASTADLAIVLVDARNGVVEQTRATRSSRRCSASRTSSSRSTRWTSSTSTRRSSTRSCATSARSAAPATCTTSRSSRSQRLHGDNVVERSERMPWYGGRALLDHLETVEIGADRNLDDVRFPVQWVIRPSDEPPRLPRLRRPGRRRRAAPRRRGRSCCRAARTTTIASIETLDGPLDEAFPPMSVTLRLADDLDVSRGDLICRPDDQPALGRELSADVCWMTDAPLRPGGRYAIKHTTHAAAAIVDELVDRLDVNTLDRDDRAGRARPQRHRPRAPAHVAPAGLRPLRAQPLHRLVHPHRRGDERHGRRRDDRLGRTVGARSACLSSRRHTGHPGLTRIGS